ncbi:MAG: hypothetical protein PHR53_02500 [Bacteroidales bacterium]|nr:hypothetical protein [Bacteroidales bacterium]
MEKDERKQFSETFTRKMQSIPVGEYKAVKKALIEHCQITASIYYNLRSGRSFLNINLRRSINEFFNEKVF